MEAAIIYESMTGTTRQAARTMGDALWERQIRSTVMPVDGIDAGVVADADLVIVGSWTDGLLVVGQRPGKAGKLRKLLPDLSGKRCVVFCTYAINSGKTLAKLQEIVEAHGGEVVGGLAIRRDGVDAGARDLIARTLDAIPA